MKVIKIVKYVLIVFVFGCNQNNTILHCTNCGERHSDFPKYVNLNYNGYALGKAKLLNTSGDYALIEIEDGFTLTNTSVLKLKNISFLDSQYEFTIDSIPLSNNKPQPDTIIYTLQKESKIINNKIIDLVNEIVDTLNLHSNDSLKIPNNFLSNE